MRPINYDRRAASARAKFRVRDYAPRVVRAGVTLYIAQAVAGFAVGFAIPILHTMGVY